MDREAKFHRYILTASASSLLMFWDCSWGNLHVMCQPSWSRIFWTWLSIMILPWKQLPPWQTYRILKEIFPQLCQPPSVLQIRTRRILSMQSMPCQQKQNFFCTSSQTQQLLRKWRPCVLSLEEDTFQITYLIAVPSFVAPWVHRNPLIL